MRHAAPTCTPTRRAATATARWEALGTTVVLRVAEPPWLPRAGAILARELDAIDRACSRFLEDSDLSRVNTRAGGRPVPVAPLLIEALQVALRAAELTDGDVDPTVGAALVLAGYDRDFSLMPSYQEGGGAWAAAGTSAGEMSPYHVDGRAWAAAGTSAGEMSSHHVDGRACAAVGTSAGEMSSHHVDGRACAAVGTSAGEMSSHHVDGRERAAAETPAGDRRLGSQPRGGIPSPPTLIARRLSGYRTVRLDATFSTVRIPSGIVLDLGATAKAWAADRGARAVWEATRCGVLVSLGGDIATAGPAPAGGWRIHVADDHRSGPDAPGQTVTIVDGGLASSSVAVRRWQCGGQTMHHIIDPSSGAPARGPWRTVSVAAADCTDANIAATAALVRGRRAPAWLDALGLPARLVAHDGAVLRIGDWPLEGSLPRADDLP